MFKITFEPSGRQFDAASDEEILTAGIRAGLSLPYGCKDGACGACKCKKLLGTVAHKAHQDTALSAKEQADGFVLTCCAYALSDVVLESRLVGAKGAWPVVKMPVRVVQIKKISEDVALLRLQLPAGNTFQYHAGQYIDVHWARGAIGRSYSMAGRAVVDGALELHLRHMPGGRFTDHVFLRMQEKEILRIEGPFGSFYLRESVKPIVFLASGTGFAPIKAILEHMMAKGITRSSRFFWGGRRPQDLYMHDWVAAQLQAMPNLQFLPVISDVQLTDNWQGLTGLVHQAVMKCIPDLSNYQVYACGAPAMIDAAKRDFVDQCGLPQEEFFSDSFTSEADKN